MLISLFLYFTFPVYAVSDLELSEFYPDPPGDETPGEFIELHNTTDHDLALDGWKISDVFGTVHVYPLQDHVIHAGGYLVLYRQETGIVLNNDQEQVQLTDLTGQAITQSGIYTQIHEGKSFSFADGTWGETSPTPGEPNVIPSPSPTPLPPSPSPSPSPSPQPMALPVQLNEIGACIKDGPEWIELYNPNNFPVDVRDWKVLDSTGKGAKQLSNLILPALGYGIKEWPGSYLNNDEDEVQLIHDESVIETFSYDRCYAESSWAKDENRNWKLTTQPTKANKNTFPDTIHMSVNQSSESAAPSSQPIIQKRPPPPPKYEMLSFSFTPSSKPEVLSSHIDLTESDQENNTENAGTLIGFGGMMFAGGGFLLKRTWYNHHG